MKRIIDVIKSKTATAKFNKRTDCFVAIIENDKGVDKQVRLKGLVPAIKDAFYRNYVFQHPKSNDEKAPHVGSGGKQQGHNKRAGIQRGKTLDATIARAVATGNFNPPCRASRHVFAALKRMNLTPVMTQVPVHGASKALRIGTACDLLCLTPQNDIVLIEIKTGYSNINSMGNAHMGKPLQSLTNCPSNQHQLQLAVTKELFRMTTGLPVKDAFVMRVLLNGVEYKRISPTITNSMHEIVEVLKKSYSM
jgi:hypothetical protein